LCFSIAGVKDGAAAMLMALLGPAPLGGEPGFWGRAAMTAGDILALDAGLFLAHYLQHRVPALWEFHKTHHSAAVLMPITVFRMHPVDLWLNFQATGILLGLNAGVFAWLYGTSPSLLALNGINIVFFLFLVAGYHLRHSHVWVMYPRWIARHIS